MERAVRNRTIDGLTTADALQAALDEAGSWAGLSRRADIPESTLKSRGKRLGVRLRDNRSSQAAGGGVSPPSGNTGGQPTDPEDRPESYFEAMAEFFMNIGFSGYPAQHGMLEFARDLGLDQKTMWQVADKAVELAGYEYDRVVAEFWQVWEEWAA